MSDISVSEALRSRARLVVIEAPAGCGKTFQAAKYAGEIAPEIKPAKLLILTHTHAACDVFAMRTKHVTGYIEIRTIDSLISQVASMYHAALDLPPDAAAWARDQGDDGFKELARKTALLLSGAPIITHALAQRYPIVICDEHQDCSEDQHTVVMALYTAGASLRIFGDPMQRIYGGRKSKQNLISDLQRWEELKNLAEIDEALDNPHRWREGSLELGEWTLQTRKSLQKGGILSLQGLLPKGLNIIIAENTAKRNDGSYLTGKNERTLIDSTVNKNSSLLILAKQNNTVNSMRAFFNRRVPIWEGHTRKPLNSLLKMIVNHAGEPVILTEAVVGFLEEVSTGFTPSSYTDRLKKEVSSGCTEKRRGMPETLQELGKLILKEPNHKGISKFLKCLHWLINNDPAFSNIKIDYPREYWEALQLGEFEDPSIGFAEVSRRRNYRHSKLPSKAISTIHKAKGLECDHVLLVPCDGKNFPNTETNRSLLYVALSRAKSSLTFVVSKKNPSPIFEL